MAPSREETNNPSGNKRSPTRRLDDPGSWKNDESYWINKNPKLLAFAETLYDKIKEAGVGKVVTAIHRAEIKFMMDRGAKEFAELNAVDKRYLGQIKQGAFLGSLGMPENDKGLDTSLCILVNGVEVEIEADVKCSEQKTNKERIEENKKRIEQNKERIKIGKRPLKPLEMLEPSKAFLISRECWEKICILISMCTYSNKISIGFIDCSVEGFLDPLVRNNKEAGGPSRDEKRSLSTLGQKEIMWILHMADVPCNILISDADEAQKCIEARDEAFNAFYENSIKRQNNQDWSK